MLEIGWGMWVWVIDPFFKGQGDSRCMSSSDATYSFQQIEVAGFQGKQPDSIT